MGTSLHLNRRHVQSAQTSGLQMDRRTTADAAARSRDQLSQDKIFDGSIHNSDHHFGSQSPRSKSPRAIQITPKISEEIQLDTGRMGTGSRINGQQLRQDSLLSGSQSKGGPSTVEPLSHRIKPAVGQKGTAAGVAKSPRDADVSLGAIERRRSKSIGSGARGSRIAAVCFPNQHTLIVYTDIHLVIGAPPHPPVLCCCQSRKESQEPKRTDSITVWISSR